MRSEVREFDGDNLGAAIQFIQTLPEVFRRVYVEVSDEPGKSGWHLVYGDDRAFVPGLLDALIRGRRFRVSGSDEILRVSRKQPLTA
jgi:hypothetical protein